MVEIYNKKIYGTDNEKVLPYSNRRGIRISKNFKSIADRNEIF